MRTRNSKTKMPTLDHRNITSVEYRPTRLKTEKQSSAKVEPAIAAGIEWSHRQIYDIFNFLDEITETHPIKRVDKLEPKYFSKLPILTIRLTSMAFSLWIVGSKTICPPSERRPNAEQSESPGIRDCQQSLR